MKKLISISLSVIMLASVLLTATFAVSAEANLTENTLPANSKAKYYTYSRNEYVTDEQYANTFVIQNDDSADGENSMLINSNIDRTAGQQISIFPVINSLANDKTGTYTVSFKTKTVLGSSNIICMFTLQDKSGSKIINQDIGSLTPTETDEYGWHTYTMTGDALTNGASKAEFKIMKAVAPIRFDDFKLTLDGDTENYFRNGSFEEIVVGELPNNTLPVGAQLGTNGVEDYKVANYYSVSTADATDGNTSLKIYNTESWSDKEVYLRINFNKTLAAGYTYTLNLNAYKKGMNKASVYAIGGSGEINFEEKANADDGKDIGFGWKNYTTYVTADEAISGIEIKMWSASEILIDELSLKDDYGKEYIENGSFEDYVIKDKIIADITYDETTGIAEMYVANNNIDAEMNVTLITVINPQGDLERIKDYAAIGFENVAKGGYAKVFATLTTKPESGDKVRAFVWDRSTLVPYIDATTLN